MCPSAGSSDDADNAWLAVYAPRMTARLNAGAPGANLTDTDTYNLLTMCAFDTIANEARSSFCNIYDELDAAPAFAYNADLDKFYGTGYVLYSAPARALLTVDVAMVRSSDPSRASATSTSSSRA